MNYKRDEIKSHFYEWLSDTKKHQGANWIIDNMDDLHHECFNTDYYIIGTQKAIDWMGANAFDIIHHVQEYEVENFGQCTTDLSNPEKVVNMYVYIIGEEVVSEYREKQEAA